MKLDGFIAALRASGLEPDAESVADFFFLASRMPKQAELLVATSVPVPASSDTTSGGAAGTETSQGVQQALESQAESARKTGLFTPSHGAEGTVPAAEIEVPEAPALPRALEIARSLRPLSQRFRAGGTGVLDEEATAEQSAHHRQLILAFQPRHERWFDVSLVIDDTPSMAVWKTTIEAFERVLVGHGAFRDVRLWRFWADAILIDPAGRPVGSSALIAPGGRRIILILTQGVSAAWQSKAFADAILEWAHRQPTAVIQLLPERLWENTRLGEPKTLARSPRPGLPNVQWDVELPAWMKRRIPDGVALPVLALNPGCLGSWAKMLMARLGSAAPSVYWSALAATSSTDAKPDVPDLAPEERLDRFRRIASDDGFRLATALSAGPLPLAAPSPPNPHALGGVPPPGDPCPDSARWHPAQIGGQSRPRVGLLRLPPWCPGVPRALTAVRGSLCCSTLGDPLPAATYRHHTTFSGAGAPSGRQAAVAGLGTALR